MVLAVLLHGPGAQAQPDAAAPTPAQAPVQAHTAAPLRIVSLLPSATETVCALGACAQLVGVDDYSLDLPEVDHLPRLGPTWQPQLERIVQLQPDVVFVGRHLGVRQRLQALGLVVHEVDAVQLDDVFDVLHRVAAVLGVPAQSAHTVEGTLRAQLAAAVHASAGVPVQRVYVEVDAAMYSAGPASFMGQLLALLGAHNIAPAQGPAFPRLAPEYVLQQAPDLIVATHAQPLHQQAQRPGWARVPAVARGRICALTPAQRRLLIRPGPRVGEAAQVLLGCLQMPPQL